MSPHHDAHARVRLVVADDSPDFRRLLVQQLHRDGRFEVVAEAADGAVAVAAVEEFDPDAVVLDLAMPDVDGFQALEAIRSRAPDLPVVVLTGFSRDDMEGRARELGASAFVEKGPSVAELAEVVVDLVDGRPPD